MPEIVDHCPLCGSKEKSPFDQREFRGIQVTNVLCHRCGLVYQSPRMTEPESQDFYEQGYRKLYQGQETPVAKDLAIQDARATVVLNFLGGQIKPGGHILDIGCSAGTLLKRLQEQYQAEVCGVEPGRMYRQYAQSTGLQIYPSLEDLQQDSSQHFRLVNMMHVLEHLPDPLAYLVHLRDHLLEPEGWLLVEVPNLYGHDCFEVAHLVSFSPHTLTQLVERAGYKIVKIRAHGFPRSRLIPLYLTLLARPAQGQTITTPVRKEAAVKLKRWLGLFKRKVIERFLPQYAWQEM
jgi:2-polyprenyl-3-methyl-5-hydroxy-6-metoxy-1,4-benzoquinol methylase